MTSKSSIRHRREPKSKSIVEDKRKLMEKIKQDKTMLEKRIAEQTKEFEIERRLTEKRLKTWMEPDSDNCAVFERRLKRLTEREAKNLEKRITCKTKSVVKERRYLTSRLISFRKNKKNVNLEDCVRDNNAKIRDLLKDLQIDPDSGRGKKKQQRKACGVG